MRWAKFFLLVFRCCFFQGYPGISYSPNLMIDADQINATYISYIIYNSSSIRVSPLLVTVPCGFSGVLVRSKISNR